jgi:hypothetical protein
MSPKNKIIKYLIISIVLLLFRYSLSVIIIYLLPILHWENYYFKNENEFLLPHFLLNEKPIINPFTLWFKWDSAFYYQIVKNGYETIMYDEKSFHNWAFYPLYPLIIKSLTSLFNIFENDSLIFFIGITVSSFFFALSLFYLEKLLKQINFNENQIQLTLMMLIIFPSSYFFNLFYPESLSFFLSTFSLYCLLNKKFLNTTISISLALITKMQNVFLVPTFFIYFFYLIYKKDIKFNLKTLISFFLYTSIIFLPLLIFFKYLQQITGNFWAALQIQKAWQNQNFYPLSFFFTYFKIYGLNLKIEHLLSSILIIILAFLTIKFILNPTKKEDKDTKIIFTLSSFFSLLIITSY